jgi:carbon monoxide dehydrogenase subunit G
MFLKLTQNLSLGVPPEQSWKFLRDTERLAALIPGVESVKKATETDSQDERYIVHVVEKVGPFRLRLNIDVRVVEAVEPSLLRAELSGADSAGGNRISGTLSAELKGSGPSSTLLLFDVSLEILGKLAALGAVPIRRRATELFGQFAGRVQEQFAETAQGQS